MAEDPRADAGVGPNEPRSPASGKGAESREVSAEGRAPANIIALSDGTGNSSAALFRTNVWKLYRALDLEDPRDLPLPRQFAFYDDGVGSASFKPLALLGGAFGVGLARNVRDLYAFICRTYRKGDRIYLFGFSRGAFTVRVLAGLIQSEGLVLYEGDEAKLERDVAAAYRAFRGKHFHTKLRTERPFRRARDAFLWARNRLMGWEQYETTFRKRIGREADPVRIAFMGVFDTVAAYGLPVAELTRGVSDYLWPLDMPDRVLGDHVDRAMQALALDEERNTFLPMPWNEGEPRRKGAHARYGPQSEVEASTIEEERISQVWFTGVHSDVGGGYPDDSLSYVPLKWIMDGAKRAGAAGEELRFKQSIVEEYEAHSDENGPAHDSRKALAGYWRYMPRRLSMIVDATGTDRRQERRPPTTGGVLARLAWGIVRGGEPRDEMLAPKVHESVFRRIRAGTDGYAPIVLPKNFRVVRINREGGSQAIVDGPTFLAGDPGFDPERYAKLQEHVFDIVWRRRVVFFLTLFTTYALAAMPLYRPALPDGACVSAFCFLSPLFAPLKALLPAFAGVWLDSFSSHPGTFLLFLIPIVAGIRLGGALQGEIRDAMRAVWYELAALVPLEARGRPAARELVARFDRPATNWLKANGRIRKLRQSLEYRAFFRIFRRWLLPILFVVGVVYLGVAIAIKAGHAVRSATGAVCREQPKPEQTPGGPVALRFQTAKRCQDTGSDLIEGATYRLLIDIPPEDAWKDDTIPAGPFGLSEGAEPWWMPLAVPLRRHWGEGWYQPMARIGAFGNDVYRLTPKPSIPASGALPATPPACDPSCGGESSGSTRFSTEFVARSSGRLFLYVNDAVGLPLFYKNNHGSAQVTVERLVTPPPCPATGGSPACPRAAGR